MKPTKTIESNLLKIIKENSKYTDQEADDIDSKIQEFKNQNEQKAIEQMHRDQSIGNCIELPTNLKSGELDQTTESHPHFKNYDHSLETTRIKFPTPEQDPNKPMEITRADPPSKERGEIGIDWENLAGKLSL